MSKDKPLTPQQTTVMGELLAGSSVTAAAKAAGVDRATCSQWLNRPGPFRDAYHDARAQLWDETRAALARAGDKSVRVVLEALEGTDPEHRLKAALAVLRMLRLDAAGIRPRSAVERGQDERFAAITGDFDHREAAALVHDTAWPDALRETARYHGSPELSTPAESVPRCDNPQRAVTGLDLPLSLASRRTGC